MKTSRILLQIAVVVAGSLLLLCCSKSTFKSGTGLYSIKQYHTYQIMSPGDTVRYPDTKISTVAMNNNYLSWNNITFHFSDSANSVLTYIRDTSAAGNYEIIYTLQYYIKTDQVVVINGPATKDIWKSF